MASIANLAILVACSRNQDEEAPKGDDTTDTSPTIVTGETGATDATGDTGCSDVDQDGVCAPLDCDDDDPGSYPGADDPAGDGVDTDCDGGDGDFVRDMAEGAMWVPELATGEAGHVLVAGPDVDGDGLPNVIVGAPVYTTYPYELDAVVGHVTVLDTAAQALGSWEGFSESRAGISLATGGDLDGDGAQDVVIGGQGENTEGRAWIVSAAALLGSGSIPDIAVAEVRGFHGGHAFNGPVAVSPDLTGDGAADLLLQIHQVNQKREVRLYSGPLPQLQLVDEATLTLQAEADGDNAGGRLVADSDLDGDGLFDLAISAGDGNSDMGMVYVLLGPLTSSGSLADAPVRLTGSGESGEAGNGLSSASDTDGDGYADLLVGAPTDISVEERGGRAFLVPGTAPSGVLDDVALATFVPDQAYRGVGATFAQGDVDGDGELELLVAAPNDPYFWEAPGEIWIYRSSLAGTLSRSDAWRILQSAQPGDIAGASLATADLDGDGCTDIAVGAPWDDEVGFNAGKVYLVMGASLDP